jgi:DASH complex subunit SPC19
VSNLLNRVSNYLDKLERREQSLIAKYELQLGRLQDSPPVSRASIRTETGQRPKSRGGEGSAVGPVQQMKMHQLRQKKERLSFAIERLQLQSSHKQRELRKSMAAQPQILDDEF